MKIKLIGILVPLLFIVLTFGVYAQNTIVNPASPTPNTSHDLVTPTKPATVYNTPTVPPYREPTKPPLISPSPLPSQIKITQTIHISPKNNEVYRPISPQGQTAFTGFVQAKRMEALENSRQKRKEFTRQLSLVKDQKKKDLVVKIDNKVSILNQGYVEKFAVSLDSLQQILGKISSKEAELKNRGIDTNSLRVCLLSSQKTIDSAKIYALSQAAREYVATISAERNLKENIGVTVNQFSRDIKSVYEKVQTAKNTVYACVQELAKLSRVLKVSPAVTGNSTNSGLKY